MAIAGRLQLEAQLVKSHANSWSGPMQIAGQVSAITHLAPRLGHHQPKYLNT
jgi:hypothetical protein